MNEPEQLIAAYLDDTLGEADRDSLNAWLKADAANMRRFTEAVMFEQQIRTAAHADAEQHAAADFDPAPTAASAPVQHRRRFQWRPLVAAAAGIVFGIFCTSVVFAYVRPTWETTIALLKEGFESGDTPLVTGAPTMPDRWSGDFTEIVGEQQGVKPEQGKKMLRFLRIDSEGKEAQEGDRYADLYRLVDMRPYRAQFADGGAVVQFSARFNAFAFPKGDTYYCRMSLRAYDTPAAADGAVRMDDQQEGDDLAVARAARLKLDRNPATWQQMTGDLRLPPDTNFLLIHIKVYHKGGPSPDKTFAGHYLDDVQLTMTRRSTPL